MKRLLGLRAAIGLALASAGSPVLAASEEPSPELDRFYLRLASGPRDLARMATCLVNRNPAIARQLFDYEEYSEAYYDSAREFAKQGGNCLFVTWELRSSNLMLLGAVAEELIRQDQPPRPVRASSAPGSSTELGGGAHLWTWRNLTERAANRSIPLSACLLERHPDQVEAVLDARQTSNGERELFNALNDEINTCIPAGETWTLQPQILRAAMAVAYYRSARAAGTNANNEAAG